MKEITNQLVCRAIIYEVYKQGMEGFIITLLIDEAALSLVIVGACRLCQREGAASSILEKDLLSNQWPLLWKTLGQSYLGE